MDITIVVTFTVAFFASVAGSEIGHRFKSIKRKLYIKLAIHLCSGFAGALLVLILLSRVHEYPVVLALVVGVSYGFFMANAKFYDGLK
jgi:hypothetical protein